MERKVESTVETVAAVVGTVVTSAVGGWVFVMLMMPFVFPLLLVGGAVLLWHECRPRPVHSARPAARASAPKPSRLEKGSVAAAA
jgi:hypothetical protein